ncbi:MAG: MFS transporter, partial [Rhodoluna sp.]
IGGPASMIAFDYSRTSIPLYRLGSTNGIINSGGFVASFSCMFLVGFILDAVHEHRILGAANLYSLAAFKLAFPVELVMISAGLVFFFIERTKTRGINSNA